MDFIKVLIPSLQLLGFMTSSYSVITADGFQYKFLFRHYSCWVLWQVLIPSLKVMDFITSSYSATTADGFHYKFLFRHTSWLNSLQVLTSAAGIHYKFLFRHNSWWISLQVLFLPQHQLDSIIGSYCIPLHPILDSLSGFIPSQHNSCWIYHLMTCSSPIITATGFYF